MVHAAWCGNVKYVCHQNTVQQWWTIEGKQESKKKKENKKEIKIKRKMCLLKDLIPQAHACEATVLLLMY